MTPRPPDDAELQALYRAAAQETPDPAIDARLLAAAQQLAAERQASRQRPAPAWWKRWLVPVSITAVAVLGVSLSLQVNDQQAVLQAQRQQPTAPEAAAEAPSTQKPERQDAAGAPPYPPALADRSAERPASRSTAPTAAPPAEAAASRATPQLQKKTEGAPTLAKEAHREKSSEAAVPPVPPPAAAVAPAAPPAPAAAEHRARSAEMDAPASQLGGAAAKSAWGLADQKRDSARHEETPEHWLERIRQLRRDGQPARADEELRRFRERYPAFVLPPDLR